MATKYAKANETIEETQPALQSTAPTAEEEKIKRTPNKGVYTCKFLCAKFNKDGDKVGVALLDYSSMMSNGQIDCLGLDSPVISTWIALTQKNKQFLSMLLDTPPLVDVGCVLSGEGKYTKLHDVLTPEEFEFYRSIVNKSNDSIVDTKKV